MTYFWITILVLARHRLSDWLGAAARETHAPFSDENEVGETVHDNSPLVLLDHARQHAQRGRQTRVVVAQEHVDVRALFPVYVERCVDRSLHVSPVEVKWGLCLRERATRYGSSVYSYARQEVMRMYVRETEYVPQDRESVEDAVNVKCGVDGDRSVEDRVPDVAASRGECRISGKWKQACRGIRDEFIEVPSVVASVSYRI